MFNINFKNGVTRSVTVVRNTRISYMHAYSFVSQVLPNQINCEWCQKNPDIGLCIPLPSSPRNFSISSLNHPKTGTASAGKVVCNRKRLAYSELAIWTKRRSTVALLTL